MTEEEDVQVRVKALDRALDWKPQSTPQEVVEAAEAFYRFLTAGTNKSRAAGIEYLINRDSQDPETSGKYPEPPEQVW